MQSQFRTEANKDYELWLGLPKGGRTLGTSDAEFLKTAGISVADKITRVDDYTFTDTATDRPLGIRAWEMKPVMAINALSKGMIDCAIIGRDIVKEFNIACNGRKGIMQAVEVLDTGMSNCALTIAVKDNDPARTIADLDGRIIVTKYPNILANWAKGKGIRFSKIVSGINDDGDIAGGIEGYPKLDPSVTVIADCVESGESLVRYGWRPLGIKDRDWGFIRDDILSNVPQSQRQRFIDMNPFKLRDMDGVVLRSNAILVRNNEKLSDQKEQALENLRKKLLNAAKALGHDPKTVWKNVEAQVKQPPLWRRLSTGPNGPYSTSHGYRLGL